jgi:23S rRNA pseudouridine1911/1915/1917 synthase
MSRTMHHIMPRAPRPAVIAETGSFAVVYKPPLMHSAPLKRSGGYASPETGGPIGGGSALPEVGGRLGGGMALSHNTSDTAATGKAAGSVALSGIAAPDTLLDWYAGLCPSVREVRGRQAWEGGLLHRLDYETDGLAVFAKTPAAFDDLYAQQEAGGFVKEYIALARLVVSEAAYCFPPKPSGGFGAGSVIESAFRPFGPGRKAVRPCLQPFPQNKDIALDHGGYYRTEILAASGLNDKTLVRIRLIRGFRHQIRCHLAWIGHPLAGDALYGGLIADRADGGFFLRACALSFRTPDTHEPVRFEISE